MYSMVPATTDHQYLAEGMNECVHVFHPSSFIHTKTEALKRACSLPKVVQLIVTRTCQVVSSPVTPRPIGFRPYEEVWLLLNWFQSPGIFFWNYEVANIYSLIGAFDIWVPPKASVIWPQTTFLHCLPGLHSTESEHRAEVPSSRTLFMMFLLQDALPLLLPKCQTSPPQFMFFPEQVFGV